MNDLHRRSSRGHKMAAIRVQDIPAETRYAYDNLLKAFRCFNCDMILLNVKAMTAILEHLPAT